MSLKNINAKLEGDVQTSGTTTANVATFDLTRGGDDSTYVFQGMVAGHDRTNGLSGGYFFVATAKNDGGVTSLTGSTFTPAAGHEDDPDWSCTVDVDAATDVFRVRVTGDAGQTVDWNCQGTALICRTA